MVSGRVAGRRVGFAFASLLLLVAWASPATGMTPSAWSSSRARADVGSPDPRPNILLLVSDDQTDSTFSRSLMPDVYGQLVDQGVSFNRGYDVSSLCCPSRSEILTGLYEHHTGVDTDGAQLNRPTIVDALHGAGYRTMLGGKYLNSWPCTPRPEFDRWVCYGPTGQAVDPVLNVDGTPTQFTGYTTDILAGLVTDFIQSTPADQPFFAMYTPISPHLPANDPRCTSLPVAPYRPPSFDEDTQNTGKPAYMRRSALTTDEIKQIDDDFKKMTQAVACLDPGMGAILNSLGDRAQNTLVIYLSDNGFQYGEHRAVGKQFPYQESVHVPFMVRYPQLVPTTQPFTSSALVENVDIAPTIAELAGFHWAADGKSLVPLLSGQATSVRDAALIEHCQADAYPCHSVPSYAGVVNDRFSYVEYATDENELYDLANDPYQLTNLAGDPGYSEAQAQLAAQLAELMTPPPPDTTIVTGPQGDVTGPTATVTFTYFSQSRFATYECRLDTSAGLGTWAPCGSQSEILGPLALGTYTFEVRGTDETGAIDPTPDTRSFTVVGAGPDVAIDAHPPELTDATTVSFGFSSQTQGATFECSLVPSGQADLWSPCDPSAGATYGPLTDGTYAFKVVAIDASGPSDPPAAWTFTVATTAPVATFAPTPADPTSGSATLSFTANEPGVAFACVLDGGGVEPCSSPATYADLVEGSHTFSVIPTDPLGRTGSALTWSWTVDTTAPLVTIISGPIGITNDTTATVEFTSDDPGVALTCALDGDPPVPCTTPVTYSDLSDGSHSVTVFATDAAGNTGTATQAWVVDATQPLITFTSKPAPIMKGTSATFAFTLSEPVVGPITCQLDTAIPSDCSSRSASFTKLAANQSHTFEVTATDLSDNVGTASYTWFIDKKKPVLTVSGPSGYLSTTTATFTLSSDEAGTFKCSLDGTKLKKCPATKTYTGLSQGPHTFRAKATDLAGNSSPTQSVAYTVDSVAPTVTIDEGPADPTVETTATFEFSWDDPAASAECSLDGALPAPCSSSLTFTDLATGPHEFAVTVSDLAGNSGTASWTWVLEPPSLATWASGQSWILAAFGGTNTLLALGEVIGEASGDLLPSRPTSYSWRG